MRRLTVGGRLFRKYAAVLFLLVGGVLLLSSLVNLYFSYQQTRAALVRLFRAKGRPTEAVYFRLLARPPRFRAALRALVADQERWSRTAAPRTRPHSGQT